MLYKPIFVIDLLMGNVLQTHIHTHPRPLQQDVNKHLSNPYTFMLSENTNSDVADWSNHYLVGVACEEYFCSNSYYLYFMLHI